MKRYPAAGLVAVILLGITSALPAEEKLYHLSRVPKFRLGDRAISKGTSVSDRLVTLPDGTIVEKVKSSKNAQLIHEVLKVDEDGKIQEFRVTIISAKAQFNIALPKPDRKDIAIEKIHFIARRKGLDFDADTTTVVSERARTLKASQIWLLKQYCCDEISFAGYPEVDAMLMPAKPVPVGHTWKPTRQLLNKWTDASGTAAKDVKGKVLSAELKFVSVVDGIALIKSTIHFQATVAGKTLTIPAKITTRIDTKSGQWVADSFTGPFLLKMPSATVKHDGTDEDTATFKPGTGKVSTLPKKIFKLGWKHPGKDTNNHIDKVNGFSLNVPKSYTAQKPPPDLPYLARFVDKRGFTIAVGYEDTGRPADVDEAIHGYLATMRQGIKSYEIIVRERLSLPDNVSAVLVVGKAHDGKVTVLTIIAVDGSRLISVSAAARSDMKDLLAELRKALKSLRLFESDMTKAPSTASEKP